MEVDKQLVLLVGVAVVQGTAAFVLQLALAVQQVAEEGVACCLHQHWQVLCLGPYGALLPLPLAWPSWPPAASAHCQ